MQTKQEPLSDKREQEGFINWDTDEIVIPGITRRDIWRRVQAMTLMDDDFMSKVFEDIPCAEYLLHTILDRDDIRVIEVRPQYEIKNLQGRSVRLDIDAEDSTGKQYDIEVQRDSRGANTKRARYNSSLLDAGILEPGEEYENLKETYVIFITEHDVLKGGKPIYHADRIIRETGQSLNDGTHIIYVNGSIQDNTPLGRLMQDMQNPNPETLHSQVLSERSRYCKGMEKGEPNMCQAVQELFDMAKTAMKVEVTQSFVLSLWQDGITDIAWIARMTKLSEEEVLQILSDNQLTLPQ